MKKRARRLFSRDHFQADGVHKAGSCVDALAWAGNRDLTSGWHGETATCLHPYPPTFGL